ncbi:M23 family metallopeptidase [Metabacillus litoralis]|uniref:M23 family metallopeptidase n=1 Tax=Metabacillus litoralis TaxID=152268 RepID=UPI00203FFAEF|nr:M23 family metallopeptidase [Metabacillus litoralis]MCM3409881.1 M23 family metallopeptidase [Metabacillus litoralis]
MREEEKKRTSQNKVQQFFRKRWVFPAIYLMSAAVILTAVLWYQSISNDVAEDLNGNNTEDLALTDNQPEAVEVNATKENFAMPAIDPDAVTVVKKFYDENASTEDQEAALVFYNNTYRMNKGIDLAREDQKQFDVVASLSGTVTKAEKDPILGYVVEIEHENDVVTVYQSLAEVSVQAGDKVEQNELLGKSGTNLYNEEDGNHVHFEVRKAGKAVNPLTYMDKPVTSVEAVEEETTEEPAKEEEVSEEAPAGEGEEAPAKDDEKSAEEKAPESDKKDAEKGETEGSEESTQPEASNSTLNS